MSLYHLLRTSQMNLDQLPVSYTNLHYRVHSSYPSDETDLHSGCMHAETQSSPSLIAAFPLTRPPGRASPTPSPTDDRSADQQKKHTSPVPCSQTHSGGASQMHLLGPACFIFPYGVIFIQPYPYNLFVLVHSSLRSPFPRVPNQIIKSPTQPKADTARLC